MVVFVNVIKPQGLEPLQFPTKFRSPSVKVLDACDNQAFNSWWVFAAAATNVGYTLRVTDTQTGQTRTWGNPLGNDAAAIQDTNAFATCP